MYNKYPETTAQTVTARPITWHYRWCSWHCRTSQSAVHRPRWVAGTRARRCRTAHPRSTPRCPCAARCPRCSSRRGAGCTWRCVGSCTRQCSAGRCSVTSLPVPSRWDCSSPPGGAASLGPVPACCCSMFSSLRCLSDLVSRGPPVSSALLNPIQNRLKGIVIYSITLQNVSLSVEIAVKIAT